MSLPGLLIHLMEPLILSMGNIWSSIAIDCLSLSLVFFLLTVITCRFPFVCVSIGLAIGKVPTVGVVYNPIIGEVCHFALKLE